MLALILLAIPGIGQAQGTRRTVAIVYQGPEKELSDFDLVNRLAELLSVEGNLRVVDYSRDSLLPDPPTDRFRLEELYLWGREVGTRYIIYLKVDQRLLERRKRRSIPLIVNRYIVEGKLTGDYILLDLSRNRMTAHWEMETTLSGPKKTQLFENNPDDPDLLLSVPRQMALFDKLEDKAVKEIYKNVSRHLKGR